MKIRVLKIDNHRNCPIYVRNFGNVFEYLFVYRKKLYTNHAIVKPLWYRFPFRNKYNGRQLIAITNMMLRTAHNHIDKLRLMPETPNKANA